MSIKRGDIYYADLNPIVGSEQGGIRPILIIQNNLGNRYSPTVVVAAITAQLDKTNLPTHINLPNNEGGLRRNSVVMLEQLRTIDRSRLREYVGTLDQDCMRQIDLALAVSFGIGS